MAAKQEDEKLALLRLNAACPWGSEKTLRLLLASNAGDYNEQDVQLKLREKHAGTSHFKDYKSVAYRLRNRISGDFDF